MIDGAFCLFLFVFVCFCLFLFVFVWSFTYLIVIMHIIIHLILLFPLSSLLFPLSSFLSFPLIPFQVLKAKHGSKFLVYNLSEKDYDYAKFHNQVLFLSLNFHCFFLLSLSLSFILSLSPLFLSLSHLSLTSFPPQKKR